MTELAPIILFVYNRLSETMQTINALKNNYLSEESDLYIYSDAGKNKDIQKDVENVRIYLRQITGFNSITIVEQNINLGLANSVINGVTEILEKHGKAIVLEDDLVTSINYLTFMNKSLNFYQTIKGVYSITGYTPPINIPRKYNFDVYFSYRAYSWGWATWYDRWEHIDWDVKDYLSFINNKKKKSSFNRGGDDLVRMLKKQMENKIDSWAIRWCYNQYTKNQVTVCPVVSKINNIGFSSNATHSPDVREYKDVLDVSEIQEFLFSGKIVMNRCIMRRALWYNSNLFKLISKIRYILRHKILRSYE